MLTLIISAALISISPQEQQALSIINQARASQSKPPLSYDSRLTQAAYAAIARAEPYGAFQRHSTEAEMRAYGFPSGTRLEKRSSNVSEGAMREMNAGLVGDTRQYVKACVERLSYAPEEFHTYDLLAPDRQYVGFASKGRYYVIIFGRL